MKTCLPILTIFCLAAAASTNGQSQPCILHFEVDNLFRLDEITVNGQCLEKDERSDNGICCRTTGRLNNAWGLNRGDVKVEGECPDHHLCCIAQYAQVPFGLT